jgi:hypothetical protein
MKSIHSFFFHKIDVVLNLRAARLLIQMSRLEGLIFWEKYVKEKFTV